MPIIRKMVQVGASKGVTLPKSWIEDAENAHGQKIEAIAMEINGLITLSPVFEPKTEKLNKVGEAANLTKGNGNPNPSRSQRGDR